VQYVHKNIQSKVFKEYSLGLKKKRHGERSVWFFSNFWRWFKMVSRMFELLNCLYKRAAQLGKDENCIKRTHRSLRKDHFQFKKPVLYIFRKLPSKSTAKVPKGIP
jgi:hypothetical protein